MGVRSFLVEGCLFNVLLSIKQTKARNLSSLISFHFIALASFGYVYM